MGKTGVGVTKEVVKRKEVRRKMVGVGYWKDQTGSVA